MLRNHKPISVDFAADIQVNTNFVLPQRGNKILRRVNNYRQTQREQSAKHTQIILEPQMPIKPNAQQAGFRTSTGAAAKSIGQSSNCRNFMLPDSPRATNYEFSLMPYEDITSQITKRRPMSTEFRNLPKRKSSPPQSPTLQPKDKEYLFAVKQASKILRKTMVLNFVDNIQRALPVQTSKSLVQPPQVVSQERINRALRKSVSKTEREINATARQSKQAQNNSVSPSSVEQKVIAENDSYRVNQTTLLRKEGGEVGQLGLIFQNYVQRPKSMRAGYTNHIQKQPASDALTKEIKLQNVLSETNASTLNINTRSQTNNIKLVFSQKTTNLTTTELQNTLVVKAPDSKKEGNKQEQNVQTIQLSADCIKNIGQLQIYVPSKDVSKDDRMMRKFVSFVSKGYLRQAEMCLQAVSENYPGRVFNFGLLALLQNNPEKAAIILQGQEQAFHNYKIAQTLINQKKVIQDSDLGSIVNSNYFKRTYPYGHQIEKQEVSVKKKQQVIPQKQVDDWDMFLMQVRRYKKDDFAKFVEDKTYFDKVIEKINHICDRESRLIPNCLTRIKQDEEVDQADTEQIVTVTQLRDTVLRDAPNLAADKQLEEVFIEMLNIQSTYCVGAKDPIQESFDFLIEGLRSFDEKFDLEVFVNEFLCESAKASVEDIKALLDRYQSSDRLMMRARTFIMSCFDSEHSQDQKDSSLNVLLRVVREAKEEKLKRMMDPARFQIESLFIHLVDDIITASRNEQGPAPLSIDDQYLATRLNFHKELSGRSKDVHLMKIVEYSKLDLENHQALERVINKPANFAKIEPGRVAKEKKIEIQKKLMATWQRHITKPLSKEEYQTMMAEVQRDIEEINKVAEQRHLAVKQNAESLRVRESQVAQGFDPVPAKKANIRKDLTGYITKNLVQKKKILDRQEQLKKLDDSDYEFSVEEEEIDHEQELELQKIRQQQELLEQNLKIQSEQIQIGAGMSIWEDHPGAVSLRQALYKIQLLCDDQNVIFDKDQVRLAPLLEKWGIKAQQDKEAFERSQGEIDSTGEVKLQKERPKIGRQIPNSLIQYLSKTLSTIKDLFNSEVNKLDDVMVENFRFFSIIDKNVRMAILKQVELVYFDKQGTLIESDVEETNYVYIVIKGSVDYMLFKNDTNVTVVAATYRTGEVFGDASIQRQYFDVFKCLSKDRKYLETSSDDVYALRIPKDNFVAAIFAEMRVELMYKILLFRNTTYFKELSPYSLVMFASICDVMDYKYGEIILAQGGIPEACYLIASGQCQAVYHYVEHQSTRVSKHARKVLQTDVPKPVIQSKADYKNFALLQARDSQVPPAPAQPQRKQKKKSEVIQQPQQLDVEGPQIKRAYFHGILKQNDKAKVIHYENHVPFGEIRQGQVFGARTLLDHLTFSKHVNQNSIRFAEQLGLDEDRWIEDLKVRRQSENQSRARSQSDLKSSYKVKVQANKEQQDQQNKSFESLNGQKKMKTQTIVTGNEEKQNMGTTDNNSVSFISNDASFVNELRDQTLVQDFQGQQKKQVNRRQTSTIVSKAAKAHSKQSGEYSDEAYHQMFIDHMHDNLMRSQTSVMVTSATAKLIVIKKEDKTFLNEALKQSVDKVIIEENFQDHDRPLRNFKEVQDNLHRARSWITQKKRLEETFLKEAKFNRRLNQPTD